MLAHDWAFDPVLEGQEGLLGRVLRAQRDGLRALARGGEPGRIVADFVRESGLYEPYAASLGMDGSRSRTAATW
jgi:hypothetical protein